MVLSRVSTMLKREANARSSLGRAPESRPGFSVWRWSMVALASLKSLNDHRAAETVVNLTGRLSKCGVVSPRFDVQLKNQEKGRITCSRPVSLISLCWQPQLASMDHEEARWTHTGGENLGFFSRDLIHTNKTPQGGAVLLLPFQPVYLLFFLSYFQYDAEREWWEETSFPFSRS